MKASLLYKSSCQLAEGPFWHNSRKSLFWTDIDGMCLYEYNWNTRIIKKKVLPFRTSMIIENYQENLILGVQGGLALFDLQKDEISWLFDVEKEHPEQRCNDGKCDSQGRLWFGTMDSTGKKEAGSLYSFDENLNLTKRLSGLTIPNGIAWSLDKKRLYHVDSPTFSVKSYHFDEISGNLEFEKEVINIPECLGLPDGMAMDVKGMLWIAHYGGHGVYCWNPQDGDLLNKIELPVPLVTSCTFGGEKLDHLFVTSARKDLSCEERQKYPLSGSVFVVEAGITGLPQNKFGSN